MKIVLLLNVSYYENWFAKYILFHFQRHFYENWMWNIIGLC